MKDSSSSNPTPRTPPQSEAELGALMAEKSLARRTVNRLKEQLNSWANSKPVSAENVAYLATGVEQFEATLTSFQNIVAREMGRIDRFNKTPEAIDQEENQLVGELETVRTMYVQFKGKLSVLRTTLSDSKARDSLVPPSMDATSAHNISFNSLPRLPKIAIPEFDGEIRDFASFKNLFENLVHCNSDISNVQKLYYLKNALKGDAAKLVRDFDCVDEAYPQAWSLLLSRYDDRRSVIGLLFRDIFAVKPIKEESDIRTLIDRFDSIVRALVSNGEKIDRSNSSWLTFTVLSRLDAVTKKDFENSVDDRSKYPSYEIVRKFLLKRSFNSLDTHRPAVAKIETRNAKDSTAPKASGPKSSFTVSAESKCGLCSQDHWLGQCKSFLEKDSRQRYEYVKSNHLCLNCLKSTHRVSECTSSNCRKCDQRHHTLLHFEPRTPRPGPTSSGEQAKKEPSGTPTSKSDGSSSSLSAVKASKNGILLPSAVVYVVHRNRKVLARVLLDSCSQVNLISEQFVRRYHLPRKQTFSSSISGIGGSSFAPGYEVTLELVSRFDSENSVVVTAEIISKIPYAVSNLELESAKSHFADTSLQFAEHSKGRTDVDLILRSDLYNQCMLGRRNFVDNLCANESLFGWVLSGLPPPYRSLDSEVTSNKCLLVSFTIEKQLEQFWKIEEPLPTQEGSLEHVSCEKHFVDTHSREENGQFVVRLPFKRDRSELSETFSSAMHSLKSFENRNDESVKSAYIEFMREYESLGHMSKLPANFSRSGYFIPHRAVLHPSSSTTKLRVVFNASAKRQIGCSLNDALQIGPSIQSELFDALLRFRSFCFAFSADIAKMYRCVLVHRDDREVQRILWRESPDQPVRAYQLNTITYGTAPASFLATRCLSAIADEITQSSPVAARVIREFFYMDDLLAGADSLEGAISLQKEVHTALEGAHFVLRKYTSNSPEFLATIDRNLLATSLHTEFSAPETSSVLGVRWNSSNDTFSLNIDLRNFDDLSPLSKRVILSEISRIFDPLGFVSPVLVRLKILMQSLWKEHSSWDQPVSQEIAERFREFYVDLSNLCSFSLARLYHFRSDIVRRNLVGFCDASEKAYCAVLYLRSENTLGEVDVRLVCSKTKVAPLKELTVPRLELQAALLLAQLSIRVVNTLGDSADNLLVFSDSQVTLCWLQGSPDRWNIFVRSRVVKIMELGVTHWHYVNTKHNPADLATRGMSAAQFLSNSLWLRGPEFLYLPDPVPSYTKDVSSTQSDPEDPPELRKPRSTLLTSIDVRNNSFVLLLNRFSDFNKLVAVIMNILKFVHRCRSRVNKLHDAPAPDRQTAIDAIIRIHQYASFSEEAARLQSHSSLKRDSRLRSLTPFMDAKGLLRVSGRLENSKLSFDQKHPIILDANSPLVRSYIRYLHLRYFHSGRSFILNLILARYWLVGGALRAIKTTLAKCTVCRRYRSETLQQIMGQLPSTRVIVSRPFSVIGIDLAGPFETKCVNHRAHKFFKTYVCFFVCFVTRAVHVEVVRNLSTEAFLDSLHRFMSRRGVPSVIHSDNGTNFVGASNIIFRHNEALDSQTQEHHISWRFIPPRSPHKGGLWEAAVRSAKHHLVRITNGQVLTYEEYVTVFTRIEGILNARPLAYRTLPDQNAELLTPAHFLIGSSLLEPDPNSFDSSLPLSTRHELIRGQINSFWSSWHKDYLNQLQGVAKWRMPSSNIETGSVVLLKEDFLSPNRWKLGVVERTFPDPEGHVRVVEVRSCGSVKKRSITTLVPLVPADLEDCSEGSPQPPEKCCGKNRTFTQV